MTDVFNLLRINPEDSSLITSSLRSEFLIGQAIELSKVYPDWKLEIVDREKNIVWENNSVQNGD